MNLPRLMLIACLLGPGAALADPPKGVTKAEVALLPPYCHYAQGGVVGNEMKHAPSPAAQRWVAAFGGPPRAPNHWIVHHYCYAQIHQARAYRYGASPRDRRIALHGVVEEINWTLDHTSPDFVLRPEMLLNRGRALMQLKRPVQALESFRAAIEAKRDYWPPYVEIAEWHSSRGEDAKAVAMLEEALKHAPDAKPVRARLAQVKRHEAS